MTLDQKVENDSSGDQSEKPHSPNFEQICLKIGNIVNIPDGEFWDKLPEYVKNAVEENRKANDIGKEIKTTVTFSSNLFFNIPQKYQGEVLDFLASVERRDCK